MAKGKDGKRKRSAVKREAPRLTMEEWLERVGNRRPFEVSAPAAELIKEVRQEEGYEG